MLVLGGADAWTGGGGPSTELRAGVGGSPLERTWMFGATSTELVGSAGELVLLDQHGGELGVSGRGIVAPRLSASAWGSAGIGWLDTEVAGGLLVRPSLRTRLDASLAAGVRGGGSVGPTAAVRLSADVKLGEATLSSRLRGRLLGGGLPPMVAGAEQWVALGDRFSGSLGVVVTAVPDSPVAPAPGLPVPGTVVVQGVLAGSAALSERLRLQVEVAPEGGAGALPYQRFRAHAGLSFDLSKRPPPVPRAMSDRVGFEHRAPDAELVELLAEFNGWEAVAMRREGKRWVLELDVPPGTWEFTYRVDGQVVVPPVAERFVPDGFGGTNGVVVVTQ